MAGEGSTGSEIGILTRIGLDGEMTPFGLVSHLTETPETVFATVNSSSFKNRFSS